MAQPSHWLSDAKRMRSICGGPALGLKPPGLDLPTNKTGPDSYALYTIRENIQPWKAASPIVDDGCNRVIS
ncbi:MAG: hypothetical protein U9N48_08270 [Euryarchaeota archaeon]|nr:hypothetical protein [Euryarchaeota archaeon]